MGCDLEVRVFLTVFDWKVILEKMFQVYSVLNTVRDEHELTQELQNATETTINPIKYEGHIQAVEYLQRNEY